ncbi:hypothetical protein EB796_024856 [Bugula neritina]|uniref:Uncharacterized protein n=1 Tax=Bugula neritina TaxID=10212 RepID=A0A7J7ISC9_BUGNE|nr:hypothetical protein EB796_024856 [Bugula neritina]
MLSVNIYLTWSLESVMRTTAGSKMRTVWHAHTVLSVCNVSYDVTPGNWYDSLSNELLAYTTQSSVH